MDSETRVPMRRIVLNYVYISAQGTNSSGPSQGQSKEK